MKKILAVTTSGLLLLMALTNLQPAYSQGKDAGIRITSNNKPIYDDETILKDMFDEVYAQKKSEIKTGIEQYVRSSYRSVSNPDIIVANPVLEILEENNKIIVRYMFIKNLVGFYVAREGISLNPRHEEDTRIYFDFDVTIDFEIKRDGLVDDLRFRKGMWTCDITRFGVTKGLSDPATVEYNRNSIKTSFPINILEVFNPLMAIQGKLNESVVSKIQKNEKLNQEMAIDEDRKVELKADVVNNALVINHPYSSIGIAKRSAKQNPGDLTKEPATNTPQVPASNSASGVLKESSTIRAIGGSKKPRIN